METSNSEAEVVYTLSTGEVDCGPAGVRIAGVELFDHSISSSPNCRFVLPPADVVAERLSRAYNFKVDATGKISGLSVVVEALNRGDIARAQIATLLAQFPSPNLDPRGGRIGLAKRLRRSGWLTKDWNPDDHPRSGVEPNPGWFAPKDQGDDRPVSGSGAGTFAHGSGVGEAFAFSGVLIDKRYDEVAGITHCTYSTPFGTFTMEFIRGHLQCPDTWPAPL